MKNLLNSKSMKEIEEETKYCKSLPVVNKISKDEIESVIEKVRDNNLHLYVSSKSDLILCNDTINTLHKKFNQFNEMEISHRLMIYDSYGF